MDSFTQSLWAEAQPLFRATLELPFNRELADGTLSKERFRHYMVQDAIYLSEYSRALSLTAAKAPGARAMETFARAAHGVIVEERALHEHVFADFGLSLDDVLRSQPSPTCLAYTSFLVATAARDDYAVGLAAVLPCFWIYWEVGREIARRATPENPYRAWIDTYSDPDFGALTDEAIGLAEEAAGAAPAQVRESMRTTFLRSTQYEWMFWDSAWRLEDWPVDWSGTAPRRPSIPVTST